MPFGNKKMKLLEIYEKVCLIAPLEERRFLNCYEDTISELESLYSGYVFPKNLKGSAVTKMLDAHSVVLPLYHNAVVDNILFCVTGEETYKSEFLRKSREAFHKYWNDNARGKKTRRREWW